MLNPLVRVFRRRVYTMVPAIACIFASKVMLSLSCFAAATSPPKTRILKKQRS